jgi:hypothetical protein
VRVQVDAHAAAVQESGEAGLLMLTVDFVAPAGRPAD